MRPHPSRSCVVVLLAALLFVACGGETVGTPSHGGDAPDMIDGGPGAKMAAWYGEPIRIDSEASGAGGTIDVSVDRNVKRIAATAVFGGSNGKVSVTRDARGLFVRCEGGCNKLSVVVPTPAADADLDLAVTSEGGDVNVLLQGVRFKNLAVKASGNVEIAASATPSATISAVSDSGRNVVLWLPGDFAADAISLSAGRGSIDLSDFPDVRAGGGRGAAGAGFRSISLTSQEAFGRSGEVVLSKL
jgi:hypothetical protein